MCKLASETLLAKILGCKAKFMLARLKAIGLANVCGRCGGSGSYSFNMMHGDTCYGCGGSGVTMPKITEKLILAARAAVDAGKLQPYLHQLEANRTCAENSQNLLNEYSAACDFEKELIAADGRKGWMIGTRRGFAVRSVMHPFYQLAQSAYSSARFTKDANERSKWQQIAEIFRQAMLNAPEVYETSKFDGETVINTFDDGHNDETTRKNAEKDAWNLKNTLAEKFSVKWPKMG